MKIYPVLLAGGQGTRLWPLSSATKPKQFIKFQDQESFFQQTLSRIKDESFYPPVIVSHRDNQACVLSQLKEMNIFDATVIVEETSRNTAAAILLAAAYLYSIDKEAVMLILPTDHVIKKKDLFIQSVVNMQPFVAASKIIVFGIAPNRPETRYGYIQAGLAVEHPSVPPSLPVRTVNKFVEKPSKELAKKYIDDGNYYWNAGYYLTRVSVLLQEVAVLDKELYKAVTKSIENGQILSDVDAHALVRVSEESLSECPQVSFDKHIAEHTDKLVVAPVIFDWCDMGTWDSLCAVIEKTEENYVLGKNVVLKDCKNCIVVNDHHLPLVLKGLDHQLVIASEEGLLVAAKNELEDLVNNLASMKKNLDLVKIVKPWGYYAVLALGQSFKIKRLVIFPKGKLSLQKHLYRSEYWVVTKGVVFVTKGNRHLDLKTGDSLFIEAEEVHRLENKTTDAVELIEVQLGKIIDEEDIIRFEDAYNRTITTTIPA